MQSLPALTAAASGQLPRAVLLAALMVLAAFSEGAGLLLLVPLLATLDGSGGSAAADLLARAGLPLTLEALLAVFVALVLLRSVVVMACSLIAQDFQAGIVDTLRRRAWRALLDCDWRVLLEMRRADNASLLISNVDRIAAGVQAVLSGLAAAVTLAALALAATAISPVIAGLAVMTGGLVLLAYRGLRRRAAALGEELGSTYDTVHLRLGESLSALRTVKLLEQQSRAEAEAFGGFADLTQSRRRYVAGLALGQVALQVGGALLLAMLVWLAVARWGLGLATILPLAALFARALPLLGAVQNGLQQWAHARPALIAAQSLIERAEAAREPAVPEGPAPELREGIRLIGVTVRFPGQSAPALEAIDLALGAGEIVAITGPSGAGKSTLADLLGGLIAPDLGTLSLDGAPLDRVSHRAWRRRTGYVEQDPVLFSATLRDNLRWAAPDASDARLEAALRDAAADFALALPQGLDTQLGDGGRRLSGGERQRLMLARTLLREPQLLILDEATNALDPASEAAITTAIAGLKGRMTIVVIAHRGGLLDLADRVVSLDRGQIAAIRAGPAALSKREKFTDYSAAES